MTDDLTTRLLAAITETERIARDARPGYFTPEVLLTFSAVGDAVHVAHHKPQAVLRHCAAHRKIIERHLKVTEKQYDRDGWHDVDLCDTCAYGRSCSHCFDTEDLPFVVWPCPTLRDLAEAYGLTIEPAP